MGAVVMNSCEPRQSKTLLVVGICAVEAFEAFWNKLSDIPPNVIMIEPLNTSGGVHAQALSELCGGRVIGGILADQDGPAELIQYNVPWLRSQRAPARVLLELFPGLTERGRISTNFVSAERALGPLDGVCGPITLRLDLPGAEMAALEALDAVGALQLVERISLRCGREVLFEGGSTCDALQVWLEERYFRIELVDSDDTDWPELWFAADPQARLIAALKQSVAEAQAERDEMQHSAEQLSAMLEDTQNSYQQISSELSKAREEIQNSRDALQKANNDAEQLGTALEDTHNSYQQISSELSKAKEEIRTSRDAWQKASNDAEQARATCDTLREDLIHEQQMRLLVQADLDELRDRYQLSEEKRTECEALMSEFLPRLQEITATLRRSAPVSVSEPDDLGQPSEPVPPSSQ